MALTVATLFGIAGIVALIDAIRFVAKVTPDGIGIRRSVGAGVAWLAWQEIKEIRTDSGVLSITTRGRSLYQLRLKEADIEVVISAWARQKAGQPRTQL